MDMISALIAWTFFGLVAGMLARLLVPGRQPMGWLATIVLGIAGSFAGGFITWMFRGGEVGQPANMIMSIIGAIIVLLIVVSRSTNSVRG